MLSWFFPGLSWSNELCARQILVANIVLDSVIIWNNKNVMYILDATDLLQTKI